MAIESSCDETAASVVVNGREVLSNVISSQIDIHTLYGGVVPEIASRKHTERINQVVRKGLSEAGKSLQEMDCIAVTYGPGLVGPLLIGVSEAKALSFATGIPLIGVHHIEGHISANYIADKELEPPFACLVVSGGHTHLVLVKDYGEYEILGRTQDDAAGEAFDKVAREIGLGYPGGPKIDKVSREGNPCAIDFPRGMWQLPSSRRSWMFWCPTLCGRLRNSALQNLRWPAALPPIRNSGKRWRKPVLREMSGFTVRLRFCVRTMRP